MRRSAAWWVWCGVAVMWAGCGGGAEDAPSMPDAGTAPGVDVGAAPAEDAGEDILEEDAGASCEAGAGDLYAQRIAPLLDESRPSSCNGCHLQGTELAAFIRGTPCEAMSCLIAGGLVSLDAPEESLILTWIARGLGENSTLPPEVAAEELEAFRAWVQWSAACYGESCAAEEQVCPDVAPASPWAAAHDQAPAGVLRCASDDARPECQVERRGCGDGDRSAGCPDGPAPQVRPQPTRCDPFDPACDVCAPEQLGFAFIDDVMRWRGRCEHCHEEGSAINVGNPPKWMDARETLAGARSTIERLEALGALDPAAPRLSLLLLKPLGEELGGVPHLGGNKILSLEEDAYLDFTRWLDKYGRCRSAAQEGGE